MDHANKKNLSQDAGSQRARLMAEFMTGRSVSTIRARDELGVMHPAARVGELKAEGHIIGRILGTVRDKYGREHERVATYTWRGKVDKP